jgi:hypothetical protein
MKLNSENTRTLFDRLLSAQTRIGTITKDKTNPYFKSKYMDINTLLEIVKPILNDEEILVLQPLSNVDGRPAITTILQHHDEEIRETFTLPDLDVAQKMGGAITYARRYAITAMLCIKADDDGNAASRPIGNGRKTQRTVPDPDVERRKAERKS